MEKRFVVFFFLSATKTQDGASIPAFSSGTAMTLQLKKQQPATMQTWDAQNDNQMMQKVRLISCIRHCCPQHSCFLFLTHTWSVAWDDDSHTDSWWPQLFCARTHAPRRALHPRELSASGACTRGQAERRAQNPATRQSDSIPTDTSKCFFKSAWACGS